ncbi:integrase catalytic domain-containing protein [Trichonephila clavipes]|nr:integrase catalytic domain-containing protein [Trichonephila clavipes]
MSSEPAPMPLNRVADCVAFEIMGIDLAGPLFLKSGEKLDVEGLALIYSDNGTNFRCASNDLSKLDWDKITRETMRNKILWKFIPPPAAWWGGW